MSAREAPSQAVLVRHAETEWSARGRHTGLTDLALTAHGREVAAALAGRLGAQPFALVLVSPSRRARETCELCGLGGQAQVRGDLHEWDYGDYEGLTSAQIHAIAPGWSLWRDGCPGGESAQEVGARADRVAGELAGARGRAAVFSHGHMLRVLGARWIGLSPACGAHLMLGTGAICLLGHEHGERALERWGCASA